MNKALLESSIRFHFSWILNGLLAVGPAPRAHRHIDRLSDAGFRSILSLCAPAEVINQEPALIVELRNKFNYLNFVLPDHRSGRAPTISELQQALILAEQALFNAPPLYVHCVAAVERSPLVCMALLIQRKGISPLAALDYMQQVHPGTNPLPQQLALLNSLKP